MNGTCPKCEAGIANVELVRGPVGNSVFGPLVAGYVAVCPKCRSVLGVMPDPANIAAMVVKQLKGK